MCHPQTYSKDCARGSSNSSKEELEKKRKVFLLNGEYNLNKGLACQGDYLLVGMGQHPFRCVYLKISHISWQLNLELIF